jgi:hypothetical protein
MKCFRFQLGRSENWADPLLFFIRTILHGQSTVTKRAIYRAIPCLLASPYLNFALTVKQSSRYP